MIKQPHTNPAIDQDRVFDAYDQFNRFGFVMFPQQVAIYKRLAERLAGKIILEAGCGNGVGSAILDRTAMKFQATDVSKRNVDFARCLYPWIDFGVWDIQQPVPRRSGYVVCVEAFEHVADPHAAAVNLLDAAYRELWLSTPNGRGKPRPPENPQHVCEYTPAEIVRFFQHPRVASIEILHWETLTPLAVDTDVDPLVYRIEMEHP